MLDSDSSCNILPSSMSVPANSIAPSRSIDDGDFLHSMGKRVREARDRRGMSRRALSESAGVSERYLAQLEAGEGNASVVLLRRVAAALGVSLTELVGHNEAPVEQRLIRRFFERLPAHRLEDVILQLMRDFGQKEAARNSRIALVGLRGAGKSTLGAALAKEIRWPFVELDREIEREAALPLSEVFMLYGQAGYRRIERRCLDRLLERGDSMVVAAGGGIVSEPETYNVLLVHCYTVWIKALPEEHMSRVISQGDFRPMDGHEAAMEDLRRILAAREPLYAKADAVVDTSRERFEQSLAKLTDAIPELARA
jgi:XRE family transcriptional regulator, aerobic/anaerobic benzoate catabolism transcriptional regulator